ncbi:MAG TPA: hypothetical protein VNJ08_04025 [Bacteriovoracaceae bacterium]|nr:hypothetical protein [Bacteriovoracaceae bacterium]
MKKLFTTVLLFGSMAAFASEDIYLCSSSKGTIQLRDLDDGSIVLDLSSHGVINMDHSSDVFSGIADSSAYTDYVLQLSKNTYTPNLGSKFLNTLNRTILKASTSENLQTCRISFALNKVKEVAELSYSCSTLFKNSRKMVDELECTFTAVE